MITWPLMKFRKNTYISGMVKAMIVKICVLLETKGPRQQTKFDPQFPKVGVADGHVTTFTISVKPPYFCNGWR